jgi:hypothetical protein
MDFYAIRDSYPSRAFSVEEIMPVRFDCPSCKANYEVADDLAGKMIMCRVCKKRGPVRSLSAPASSATTLPAARQALAAATPSRRNLLPFLGLFLASLGAIGVGALFARYPPSEWFAGEDPEEERRRRRRFGPPDEQKKDGKEGAT